ncbi:MAG: hypothetical protein ACETWG_04305, partial [Candidatus Neomarinimicrobiota bacterium]
MRSPHPDLKVGTRDDGLSRPLWGIAAVGPYGGGINIVPEYKTLETVCRSPGAPGARYARKKEVSSYWRAGQRHWQYQEGLLS